jgi:hypothetical protein
VAHPPVRELVPEPDRISLTGSRPPSAASDPTRDTAAPWTSRSALAWLFIGLGLLALAGAAAWLLWRGTRLGDRMAGQIGRSVEAYAPAE